MSSKTDILAQINPTTTYIGTKVRDLLNQVTCEDIPTSPTIYKKGDVIRVRVQKDGSSKPRPSCIIKAEKEYVVSIPLTSAEDVNMLCPNTGSRFFKEGYFCNTYVVTAIDKVEFLGVYDSPKSLNNAIKELREFITKHI